MKYQNLSMFPRILYVEMNRKKVERRNVGI